jgi:hypothetical protein
MEPSFHDLLSKAEHGQSPETIIEAFHHFMLADSPMFQIPYWQTWTKGPCKWPYGKWALDKLRWFIADPAKLLYALAELERAFQAPESFREYIEIKVPDDPVPIPSSTEVATAPEPALDPQLLAENEKLKKELREARAALAEERKAHKAALEAERQEYDRRFRASFIEERGPDGHLVNPFVKAPKRRFVERELKDE